MYTLKEFWKTTPPASSKRIATPMIDTRRSAKLQPVSLWNVPRVAQHPDAWMDAYTLRFEADATDESGLVGAAAKLPGDAVAAQKATPRHRLDRLVWLAPAAMFVLFMLPLFTL